jgi:hypothetical protein
VPVIFDIHRTPPRRRPPLKALKIQSLTLSITAKWHRPHARPSEPLLQMYVQPPTSKPSQIHKRLTCPPRRPRKNPLRYQSLPNRNQTPLPSPQRPPPFPPAKPPTLSATSTPLPTSASSRGSTGANGRASNPLHSRRSRPGWRRLRSGRR